MLAGAPAVNVAGKVQMIVVLDLELLLATALEELTPPTLLLLVPGTGTLELLGTGGTTLELLGRSGQLLGAEHILNAPVHVAVCP